MVMNATAIILEIIGLASLVFGYRKSNRNVMLVGAIVLWIGGSLGDFIKGFIDGLRGQ